MASSSPASVGAAVRTILHVDMDAFYVAVETLLDPSLKGKPVIVGGDGARGVVASCSYEARVFGIHSAMPSTRAKKLCPHAIFLRGHHALYADYSSRIHTVFRAFTPAFEPIALDEAFLDLSGGRKLFGSGSQAASAIRDRIEHELGLSCSVGVATNKLLAKLASKLAKPPIGGGRLRPVPGARRPGPGVVTVPPGSELAFLHPLPVRSLWGVGPKTFERLQRFGVETIGDLAGVPEAALVNSLGPSTGRHLLLLASGHDDRPVEPDRPTKSIGHEETFSVDVRDLERLSTELLRMADAVATRARAAGVRGRTVHLKVKLADFRLLTRSRTPVEPLDTVEGIHATAVALLRSADVRDEVLAEGARLVGVSVSNLVEVTAEQLSMFEIFHVEAARTTSLGSSQRASTELQGGALRASFEAATQKSERSNRALAGTVDAIRAKYGAVALGPASLVRAGGLHVKRSGDTQWGPNAAQAPAQADPGEGATADGDLPT